jgi:L-alanine-DL-glutamate epimerase-like enolase superfamily enzyme
MKIDHVSLTIFTWDNIPRTSYHAGSFTQPVSNLGLLRIRTDAGHEGHAFLGSASNPGSMDGPQLIRWLKPVLMGANPLERERIHQRMLKLNRNVSWRTIGAVDVALWDLVGKIAGLPVHALMGTHRTEIGAYASSQLLPDAQAYVAQAQQHKQEGWAGYKIHPPTDPDTDIKVCEAVRRAVGDSYPVMLDSTWSYDYPAALKVGLAIQEMGFKWYEDPLADEDITSYLKLRQKLNIPIMATEYPVGGLDTYATWVMQQATDYLRGDIPAKGGLTTMLKTAHLAEAFHMNYEVHHSGNSLNNLANLHVCMAIPNTTWFEVLLPDGAHRYGLEEEFRPDANGMLQAPTGPGLGAKIDFAMIKAKTEAVME